MKHVALAVLLSSCTLLDDPPPENRCDKNADCFQAQGERCNLERHVCESPPDAGQAREAVPASDPVANGVAGAP